MSRIRQHVLAAMVTPLIGIGIVTFPSPAEAATTLTVDGVYSRVVADSIAPSTATGTTPETPTTRELKSQVSASVKIGSMLVPVPIQEGITPGSTVRLSLKAPAGYTADRAVSDLAPRPERSTSTSSPVTISRIVSKSRAAEASVMGNHTVKVLPVYWGSGTDGATVASLRTMADRTGDFWREQSSKRINLSGVDVKNWKKIGTPSTCDADAIYNAAVAAHGLPGAAGNEHYIIYFPYTEACEWGGLGHMPGEVIWNNGQWSADAPVDETMPHEFGHNLGIGHANTETCSDNGKRVPLPTSYSTTCVHEEYNDGADVMGYPMARPAGNINVAFAHFLGLAEVTTAVSGKALTVTLPALTTYGKTRGLRIPLRDGTALYVELRPATGRDTRMPDWAGVQVRHWFPSDLSTELLDMQPGTSAAYARPNMPAGASFRVPNENYTIKVSSVSDSAATISVLPA